MLKSNIERLCTQTKVSLAHRELFGQVTKHLSRQHVNQMQEING